MHMGAWYAQGTKGPRGGGGMLKTPKGREVGGSKYRPGGAQDNMGVGGLQGQRCSGHQRA